MAALVACTAEWVRVLKPSGSIFVNLGDKYTGSGPGGDTRNAPNFARHFKGGRANNDGYRAVDLTGYRPKSLLGLPWRYALACMDQTLPYVRERFLEDLLSDVLDGIVTHDQARAQIAEFDASPKSKGLGLILRRDIIWAKPNGLPESVTDRCRSSHEYLFHFTVRPRYYAAVDEIREPHEPQSIARTQRNRFAPDLSQAGVGSPNTLNPADACNPLGKLPGSVWEIPSQPLVVPAHLGVDHFAAFPMELPRRVILGWSPPGVCTECGEGRRPVTDKAHVGDKHPRTPAFIPAPENNRHFTDHRGRPSLEAVITGYACACPDDSAPTRPAVIVDPFSGTGTTALVASTLGRIGIGVDRSMDYARLARWRTADPGEIAKAMQVPKPPPIPSGQGSLFDDLEAS